MTDIEEEIARKLAAQRGATVPAMPDEDAAAALMPLVKRAQAEVLRDMAKRVRADFANHGMTSTWVGALDDEADRIERGEDR